MPIKVLLCFNGFKDPNKFVLDRNAILLRYALEEMGIEYTYDYKEHYDLVHVFSLNQLKSYYSCVKPKYRKKIVFNAFTDYSDFKIYEKEDIDFNMKTKKFFDELKNVDSLIVDYQAQELILKHQACPLNIKVSSLGAKDYRFNNYLDIEKNAFRKFYKIENDKKIIFTYGEYDYDKGIDTLISIARNIPEYEFFFFGGKQGILSNSKHYDKINNIANLHFEDHIHRELYHSLLMNATCLFLPYKYHLDSALVLESMKQGISVVCSENIFLYDLLIDKKTCLIGNNFEDFYLFLKNIEKVNFSKEAMEFTKDMTIKNYGNSILKIYKEVLNID